MASGWRRAGSTRRAFPAQCADEINLGKTRARGHQLGSDARALPDGSVVAEAQMRSRLSGRTARLSRVLRLSAGDANLLLVHLNHRARDVENPCPRKEPAVSTAIRGFVVLSVLLWLIAALSGMPVPGAGGSAPALADNGGRDHEGGPPGGLCSQPGDADQ